MRKIKNKAWVGKCLDPPAQRRNYGQKEATAVCFSAVPPFASDDWDLIRDKQIGQADDSNRNWKTFSSRLRKSEGAKKVSLGKPVD